MFYFTFIYLFIYWPHHAASGILVPQPGIEPKPLSMREWSETHFEKWNYCEQLYTYKFDYLDEMDKCLEKHNLSES